MTALIKFMGNERRAITFRASGHQFCTLRTPRMGLRHSPQRSHAAQLGPFAAEMLLEKGVKPEPRRLRQRLRSEMERRGRTRTGMRGELGWGGNRLPWPGTPLLLAPPRRNGSPSTEPGQAPAGAGTLVGHSPPRRPLASLKSPPLPRSFPPRHPGLRFWQLSQCPRTTLPQPRTCAPQGPHAPTGTPGGVGASRGRERGVQRGALRARTLRSQGYHVMLAVAMATVVSHKERHK